MYLISRSWQLLLAHLFDERPVTQIIQELPEVHGNLLARSLMASHTQTSTSIPIEITTLADMARSGRPILRQFSRVVLNIEQMLMFKSLGYPPSCHFWRYFWEGEIDEWSLGIVSEYDLDLCIAALQRAAQRGPVVL